MSDGSVEETQVSTAPLALTGVLASYPSAEIAACFEGEWLPPAELFNRICAVKPGEDPLTIDLSGLEHLQAAALQVLLAADLEWQRQGRRFTLLNVSNSLQQWFALSGATFNLIVR